MKNLLIASAAILLFTTGIACNNEDSKPERKDLLDPSMVRNPHTADGVDPKEAAQLPAISFTDTSHYFGTVNEGEKLAYEFSFTNTGKQPLLISGTKGSCGCTVSDYPRQPVAPGKTAVINVIFNTAGKTGHQEKSIEVAANTLRGVHQLYIQADVTPTKE